MRTLVRPLGETVKVTRTITHDVPANSVSAYSTCYKYDNLGRMTRIDLPGGEVVNYAYDAGGLLKKAVSVTSSGRYEYVKEIQYDHFGQRTMISYGNGSTSHYTYDPVTRRLANLTTTGAGGETYQNINYSYDDGGNILTRENRDFVTSDSTTRTATQEYTYDDLDRLTGSKGKYDHETWHGVFDSRVNSYTSRYTYDSIGNITRKEQANTGDIDGSTVTIEPTTYTWDYAYGTPAQGGGRPHAVTSTGPRSYTYDANGNMTVMTDTKTKLTDHRLE